MSTTKNRPDQGFQSPDKNVMNVTNGPFFYLCNRKQAMNPQKYRCRFTRLITLKTPAIRYRIVNSGRPFQRAPWGRILPAFLLSLFLSPAEMTRSQSVSPGTTFTNYVQKINGSTVTFEMVAIPGGSILVGSPPNELGRDTNDLPCRPVVIKPFWIGRYEVTWQEYLPFVFYDRSDIIREGNKLEGKIDRALRLRLSRPGRERISGHRHGIAGGL